MEMENTTLDVQEQEPALEDSLFDEDWDDTEAEGGEPTEEQAPAEQTYTVKYNGAEQQLTMEQLIEHAQKGMNYDKVRGERDSLREGNIYKAMQAYGKKMGMGAEDAAKYLLDTEAADAELEEEKTIRDQYGNLPNEVIRELVAARTAGKKRDVDKAAEAKEQERWGKALEAYPDLNMDNVPASVMEAVSRGVDPLMALRENEIAQLKAQLASASTEQKNELNRARSVGSVRSNGGAEKDPFLQGFGL